MIFIQAITNQGAISADWVLVGAFVIIGFLLVFIANLVGRHFIKLLDALTARVDKLDIILAKLSILK